MEGGVNQVLGHCVSMNVPPSEPVLQEKYSAYRMSVFPCSCGGCITTGQEAGQMAAGSTWGHDVRRVLEKDGVAAVDHLPAGTVHPEHHLGPLGCGVEQAEMFLAGCVW